MKCFECGGEMDKTENFEGEPVLRCPKCHIWYDPKTDEWTKIVVLDTLWERGKETVK